MINSRKMDKFTSTPTDIDSYVQIIYRQLYFAVIKGKSSIKLKNNVETLFFCIDDELVYQNYYNDFGPLNLSCLYKYCLKLNKYLEYSKGLKNVVHYTCSNSEKRTNAACLIGSYCLIYLNSDPKDVWKILQQIGGFKPFLDASQYSCGFTLKIPDILHAVHKAVTFSFFNFNDFNVGEYDLYDTLQHGDLNWLVPRKFLAFIGPADNGTAHPPEFYINYFLKNDVKTVIRLNSPLYDPAVFTQVGIHHYDLIFPDGATPPRDVLLKFLAISEMAPAAIAVHCKAGLGRTGSLIGAYLIKHYHMTARETIAWMRLCRPGSVIGQQQIWLEKIESWLWRIGSQYRVQKYGAGDKIPRHRYGIYSRQWPAEREKIIANVRNKLQMRFTNSQFQKIARSKKGTASIDSITKSVKQQRSLKKLTSAECSSYKSVSKLISSIHGIDKGSFRNLSRGLKYEEAPFKSENLHNVRIPQTSQDFATIRSVMTSKDNFANLNVHTQGDKLNEKKAAWYQTRAYN